MAYTPNPTWENDEVGATPVDAAALNHLEGGLVAAAAVADTAQGDATTAAAAVTALSSTMTTDLATKADAAATATALAAKADAAATTTALAAKADAATMTTDLAAKADLVSGKVPTSQLPAIPTFTTHPVSSQVAMLALTAAVGDVAVRTDQANARYLLVAEPPSTLGNWLLLNADPAAAVESINGHVGAVTLGYADVGADQAGLSATETARAEAAEALLAPLLSPVFTGSPVAPTQSTGDNSTKLATTALVSAKITALGALIAGNNLSDVASTGTARANLHVPILSPAELVVTTNVASLTGLQTFPVPGGTYTMQNNDVVLLAGQTTASQDGPWQAPATGTGAWARPADFPSGSVVKGRVIPIMADGSLWTLVTTASVTVDTTAQVWQLNDTVATASEVLRSNNAYVPATFQRIFLCGHSLAAGGGAPGMEQAWHNLLAGMMRSEIVNHGRGGAVAGWAESNVLPYGQTGDGGVGHLMAHMPAPLIRRVYKGVYSSATTYAQGQVVQTGSAPYSWWVSQADSNINHDPTTDTGANWLAMSGDQSMPWEPRGQLPIVFFGNNDLGWVGNWGAFQNAMRAILSLMNASEVTCRGVDPRCTYTGAGWTAGVTLGPGLFSSGVVSGGRAVASNTTDVETIVTPADWAGGYVSATYVAAFGTLTTAGVFQVQVDGSTVLTKNISTGNDPVGGVTTGKGSVFALRFQVPSGAHAITIKQTTAYSGGSVALYTDALIFEATNPAPCIVPGLFKYLFSTSYATLYGGGTTMTDAVIDTWNGLLQTFLTAEFPNAVYHLLNMSQDASTFYVDGVHRNAHGHALIAEDLFSFITNTVAPALTAEQKALLSRPTKVGRAVHLGFGWDFATGSITIPTTAWTVVSYTTSAVTGYTAGAVRFVRGTVAADPGDVIQIDLIGLWSNTASAAGYVDFATMTWPNGVTQTAVANRWVSGQDPYTNGPGAQAQFGLNTGQNGNLGVFGALLAGGSVYYRVRADDLTLGEVTLQLHAIASGASRALFCSGANRIQLALRNLGQESWYEGELAAR